MLEEGVEVDPRDGLNRTPLLDASLAGQTQCVIALLQHGAKVDASDVYMKNCLHFAVENEHLASLNVLLSNEKVLCNVDRPDVHERVPLHYAAIAHNVEVIDFHYERALNFLLRSCSGDSRKGNGLIPELEISKLPLSPLENIFQSFPLPNSLPVTFDFLKPNPDPNPNPNPNPDPDPNPNPNPKP